MFRKLLKSIREYKKPTLLTFLFITGEAVVECLIPFVTADLVDRFSHSSEQMSGILKTGALLCAMAVLSLLCGGLAGLTSSRASSGFAKNLRHDMFYRVQGYAFSNIDRFSSSSLVTRMTTDVSYVQMAFMMVIRMAVRAPLVMIFSIVMAYIMGGNLALSFVVIIPVLAVGLMLIAKFAMPAFRRVFKKYDRLNESIEENVQAMRVVKGFSREEYEKGKFCRAADGICRDFTRAERIVALSSPIMQVCVYFNMVFVLIVGSKLIISGGGSTIGVGEMSAMLTYGIQILIQLMMLSMVYVMITMSDESAKRIVEVLDETSELQSPENGVRSLSDGSVDFEGVNFRYAKNAQKNALSDLSFHIDSGMTVGIIGGTGSGKSSLIQLIPRLYDVSEGCVKVGGVDVRHYDLQTLRDGVAVVLQKNLLFSGTILENLRWGNESATEEECIRACRIAQADGFIQTFPEGYNTYIEQGGTNVSGGQKQRICIARALLKNPKILILDDSTSAVDTKTDALIREAFRTEISDTTKIIIAQRISSVQDADLILVLEDGKIRDMGRHEELLKNCEIYREIYEQQTKGGDSHEES